MALYGLDLKNDESIGTLDVEAKKQYDAAVALGTYIHTNKDKYKISVYEGEDGNELKQLLLVFKLKTNTEESSSDAEDWPINKIDTEQDEFAFLHTIFKEKFVQRKFNAGIQVNAPNDFGVDFKTKEYQMLELFFAFNAATPRKSDFTTYNSASDDDNIAKIAIKRYIVSLVENDIKEADLDGNIKISTNESNPSNGVVPGTITFNYEGYNITKIVKFVHVREYELAIKSSATSKTANEVIVDDIEFGDGVKSTGISINEVRTSTTKLDGSIEDGTAVKVTFKGVGGVTPLVESQRLGGFTSYKEKAWEVVDAMSNNDFNSIKTPGSLASVWNEKSEILDLIKTKIMTTLAAMAYKEKVRDSIGIDDITLVSNDNEGSLTITIAIDDDKKEFVVSGFLTSIQKDANNKIRAVNTSTINDAPTKINVVAYGSIPREDDINSPTQSGFSFEFISATNVNDKGESSVVYKVGVVPPVDGTTTKLLTFKVGGFQTKDQADVNFVKIEIEKNTDMFIDDAKANIAVVVGQPFNQAAFNSLGKDGTFPVNIKDTTLTYSHSGITNDGVLDITVKIVKGDARETAAFSIDVTGINKAKADQNDVNFVKVAIDGFKKMTKTTNTNINKIVDQVFNKTAFNLLGKGGTFPINIKETTLTYSHGIKNSDGELTVTVTIKKGEAKVITSFIVDVTGIDEADVKFVKAAIDGITRMNKNTNTKIIEVKDEVFNNDVLVLLGGRTFPNDIRETTLTYSHGAKNSDGELTVTVKIEKGAEFETATFNVDVSGIDQADVDFVKTAIEEITGMTKNSDVNIDKITKQPFNITILQELGDGGNFPNDIKSTTLTYSHDGRTSDGDLVVTVKIEKGEASDTATFNVEVTGIDQAIVASVKTAIEKNNEITANTDNNIEAVTKPKTFDHNALEELGKNWNDLNNVLNIKGATLTYTHGGKTSNGTLIVTIKIVKGKVEETATVSIAVSGIDEASYNRKNKVVGVYDQGGNLDGYHDDTTQKYYWATSSYNVLDDSKDPLTIWENPSTTTFQAKKPISILKNPGKTTYYKIDLYYHNDKLNQDSLARPAFNALITPSLLDEKLKVKKVLRQTIYLALDKNLVMGEDTKLFKFIKFKNSIDKYVLLQLYFEKNDDKMMLMADINAYDVNQKGGMIIEIESTKITETKYNEKSSK